MTFVGWAKLSWNLPSETCSNKENKMSIAEHLIPDYDLKVPDNNESFGSIHGVEF